MPAALQPEASWDVCRKKDELIHTDVARAAGIDVIKRFSGGGTVVVDHNTVFATLIMQASAIPGVECYPRPVMQWSEGFYKPLFSPHGAFQLQEHGQPDTSLKMRWGVCNAHAYRFVQGSCLHQCYSSMVSSHRCKESTLMWRALMDCIADYTFGERKFGGNAQAITKQRWLHHTSFLWDFDDRNMALLKHPSRVPEYRMVSSWLSDLHVIEHAS